MQNLRRSLTRQVLLLGVGSSFFSISFLLSLGHFMFGRVLFGQSARQAGEPGEGIVSPMAYSLHLAGVLVMSLGVLWLALACRRRGITFRHWTASFLAMLPFFLVFLFTAHWGFGTDWPPPWPFLFLMLFPHALALLLGYMPILFHRKQPLPKDSAQPTVARLDRPGIRHIWILSILLLLAWLLGSLYLQNDWSRDRGFDSGLRHMVGANLPILPAAAALLLVLTMQMSPRAQKILYVFVCTLQAAALVATVLHPFKGGEEAAFVVVPLALALHAWWLWVSLKLLEPLYGLDMTWMRLRASLD